MKKGQDHKWMFIIVFGGLALTFIAQQVVDRYYKAKQDYIKKHSSQNESKNKYE